MQGKYESRLRYLFVKSYRGLLRLLLRPLVSFKHRDEYEGGYTILIGAMAALPDLLLSNLACLAKQELESLRETIVVLDERSDDIDIEARVQQEFPGIRCRFVYWTRIQRFVSRTVRWGWVNSWMSWSIGIANTRTRYAMLHDFDAMLISPRFVEERFERIREAGCEYLGVQYYQGQGLVPEDELVTTFELFFDVSYLVKNFKPIHLFNHVALLRGRSIDFDTFLFAQSRGGSRQVMPWDLDEMVHPSQMICQYVFHLNADRRLPRETNNLMVLPYFFSVSGSKETLTRLTRDMRDSADGSIVIFGRDLDVGGLADAHVAWIVKQATHLEQALFGEVRPEVGGYLDALAACAGREFLSADDGPAIEVR